MSMFEEKIYSTGQVAKICGVSPRTVITWIKSGHLIGTTLPDSVHRRIYGNNLLKFLKAKNFPIPPDLHYVVEPFVLFMDGNGWCCTRLNFINLQESPAGFGETLYEAQQNLLKEEQKIKIQLKPQTSLVQS
jgi:hypothetical protein